MAQHTTDTPDQAKREQYWRIEKRVANTDQWRVVGHASSRHEAEHVAGEVIGGQSTGVRICQTDTPYREPILIVGI